MKQFLLIALSLAAVATAGAQDRKLAVGLDGSVSNSVASETGHSDYTSNLTALRVLVSVPLDETSDLIPFVTVAKLIELNKDGYLSGTAIDYDQTGFGGGLGYLKTLATAGPFAFRSGLEASVITMGAPKNFSGSYSSLTIEVSLPIALEVSIGSGYSIRVSQQVVTGSYLTTKTTTTATKISEKLNVFAPSVGFFFQF